MSIVIDDPELERELRALAAERGESVEEVVRRFVRPSGDYLSDEGPSAAPAKQSEPAAPSGHAHAQVPEWLSELQARYRSAVIDTQSTDDELLGYDQDGLPS